MTGEPIAGKNTGADIQAGDLVYFNEETGKLERMGRDAEGILPHAVALTPIAKGETFWLYPSTGKIVKARPAQSPWWYR